MNVSDSRNRLDESKFISILTAKQVESDVGYIDNASLEADSVKASLPYPEWIIQVKAAKSMIEIFPDMFTARQKELFHTRNEMSAISAIYCIARDAKKCRELNSIDFLTREIRTLEGYQRVTYYHVGDVVFVTVPGRYEGQKLVTAIFSLTDKLGQLEGIRRAAEKSGRKKTPIGDIRKMRKNPKARGFFKSHH